MRSSTEEADKISFQVWKEMVNLRQSEITKEENDSIAKKLLSEGGNVNLILYLRPFIMEKHFKILRRKYVGPLGNIDLTPEETKYEMDNADENMIVEDISLAAYLNYITDMTLIKVRESFSFLSGLGLDADSAGDDKVYIYPSLVNVEDLVWKERILLAMRNAPIIFIVPSYHSGTMWEMKEIMSNDELLSKTIFIKPPAYYKHAESIIDWWEKTREISLKSLGLYLPRMTREGCFFEIDNEVNCISEYLKDDRNYKQDFYDDELAKDLDQMLEDFTFLGVMEGDNPKELELQRKASSCYRTITNITNMSDLQILEFSKQMVQRVNPEQVEIYQEVIDSHTRSISEEAFKLVVKMRTLEMENKNKKWWKFWT